MANPIKEAFGLVKRDILGLKDRIGKSEDEFEVVKDSLSGVNDSIKEVTKEVVSFPKEFKKLDKKLDKINNFQKELLKNMKSGKIEKELDSKSKKVVEEAPKTDEIFDGEEEFFGDKKERKGLFGKIGDFFAEEED
ncbi:MAG: hypothetical protein CMH62_00425 [Nanoarchaeota archaeon]|nr:hypothetical protein [Nanoarchaeota archaeon]|tara:strand:+ start:1588 stop:1995 length:408 start_codon:yes stop_codon:yes gene_type:complete